MIRHKRYKLTFIILISIFLYLWFITQNIDSNSEIDVKKHVSKMSSFSDGQVTSVPLKKKKQKLKIYGNETMDKVMSDKTIPNNPDYYSSIGMINSQKDIEIKEKGYADYAFNILISDRVGFNRILPDTRPNKCYQKVKKYDINIKASVIICFYNEAWSTLFRTVYSVLNRSPSKILHEIILVNDESTLQHLQHNLSSYLNEFVQSVKLIHTKKREGLIRARVKGAEFASGDVLVFLDSHCEVNTHWLEPLLHRIQEQKNTVVCPVIDTISSHTFEYEASPPVRGGFNWGMHFSWEDIPPNLISDKSDTIKSPTMAGGLFAVDRKYFFELGSYDKAMEIWGAENLEISFRIWMCGGRLEIIPCSRVGHVFRERRPYGNNGKGDTMSQNTIRLVEVWLDEYKKHFYANNPDLMNKHVNVSSRIDLRKKLKCKSFKWFLEEVYPEIGIPMVRDAAPLQIVHKLESPVRIKGKLQNMLYQLCFDTISEPSNKKSKIILRKCEKTMTKYVWHTHDNQLKVSKKLCLDIVLFTNTKNKARAMKCHGSKSGQEWRFKQSNQIYNPALGMCLSSSDQKYVFTEICDINSNAQKWKFISI